MSVRKPTTGTGGPEWSHPNSNIAYLTAYGNAEKSNVTATNSPKLTTAQLEALSRGASVSSGPGLMSTGGPPTGTGTLGQMPNNTTTSPGWYATTGSTALTGGTTSTTETTTPAGTTIPLLWVVLGVIGLVVLIALAGR
jgi:hypothetical protein